MLDKLNPEVRHVIIMLAAALLGWGAEHVGDLGFDPLLASLIGVVIATLILYITPLTRQYGIGSRKKV